MMQNVMTGKEFRIKYCTPIVYVWKRGNIVMYVGSSSHGLRRMLAAHSSFNLEEMKDDDTIEIYEVEDKETRLSVERGLIKEHKPLFNGTQGRGSLKYKNRPKSPWMRRNENG